jgi:hypothetical protein
MLTGADPWLTLVKIPDCGLLCDLLWAHPDPDISPAGPRVIVFHSPLHTAPVALQVPSFRDELETPGLQGSAPAVDLCRVGLVQLLVEDLRYHEIRNVDHRQPFLTEVKQA